MKVSKSCVLDIDPGASKSHDNAKIKQIPS